MHYPIDRSLVARPAGATSRDETHLAWTTTSRSRRVVPDLHFVTTCAVASRTLVSPVCKWSQLLRYADDGVYQERYKKEKELMNSDVHFDFWSRRFRFGFLKCLYQFALRDDKRAFTLQLAKPQVLFHWWKWISQTQEDLFTSRVIHKTPCLAHLCLRLYRWIKSIDLFLKIQILLPHTWCQLGFHYFPVRSELLFGWGRITRIITC